MRWLAFAIVGLGAAAAGCQSNPSCFFDDECPSRSQCVEGACVQNVLLLDGGTSRPTWFANVEPIVRAQCLGCHSDPPINGAPFPLVTFQDTQLNTSSGQVIHEQMGVRALQATTPNPPAGYPNLTDNEVLIIRRWSETGAMQGTPLINIGGAIDGGVAGPDGGVPVGPLVEASSASLIQDGFGEIVGMIWDRIGNSLLFSDVSNSTIYRLVLPTSIAAAEQASRGSAGLTFDPNGNLVAGAYQTRDVIRNPIGGAAQQIIADFEGDRFNGPHNVLLRSVDSQLYFTDPSFGLGTQERELDFNGLFRVDQRSFISIEWRGTVLSEPNDIAFAPGESLLYMTESLDGLVLSFDVDPTDGSLGDPTIFAVVGGRPSGIVVDQTGNVFVATASGVQVYSRLGIYQGLIGTPSPANDVAFGGEDNEILFIATGSELYAARLTSPPTGN